MDVIVQGVDLAESKLIPLSRGELFAEKLFFASNKELFFGQGHGDHGAIVGDKDSMPHIHFTVSFQIKQLPVPDPEALDLRDSLPTGAQVRQQGLKLGSGQSGL